MPKLDLKRELKDLYTASADEVTIVEARSPLYLMIDGHGDPNTAPAYKEALQALYSLAYALKFRLKKANLDYTVMPLEGLWWTDDMRLFSVERKADWLWTMMIAQPEEVTPDLFATVRAEVMRKKAAPGLDRVRLERLEEGRAAQILHVGPYAAEGPTIEMLHTYIRSQGLKPRGKHHEIYLGDPNRSAPEKLRTILRQPVAQE